MLSVWGCDGGTPAGLPTAPPDSTAVHAAWGSWLGEHAHEISSLTSDDYTDLQSLKPILAGRRLSQLGEDSHGVGSYSDAKVRLIKFLHAEMGFDVVAFESSLFACFSTNQVVQDQSALEGMRHCVYGVWHADEVLALFEYVKASYQTARPLIVAGFDMKPSSAAALQLRPGFLRDVIVPIDAGYAAVVEALEIQYKQAFLFGGGNWAQLEADYQLLVEFFAQHEGEFLQAHAADPQIALVARQTAWFTLQHTRWQQGESYVEKFLIRDRAMADNIDFLLETLYPDRKIVSWAHNYHIRHDQAATKWSNGGGYPSMGTWVAERQRAQLYTVGLHAYRGQGADNFRTPYNHGPAPPGTIEWLLHGTGRPVLLVDLLDAAEGDSTSWMRQPIDALSWGNTVFEMIPRDQYDAVLFIDEVHLPHYVD